MTPPRRTGLARRDHQGSARARHVDAVRDLRFGADGGERAQMSEFRRDADDALLPTRILHNSEQFWAGERLEQSYNYLVYEFEVDHWVYRARAYLDEIKSVAILGRFDPAMERPEILMPEQLDPRIIAYLRRRYREITILGPSGYTPIK